MKKTAILPILLLVVLLTGCKAFHTLLDSKLKTAQGAPYELIVVCNQQLWDSDLGDSLRSVLQAPIPYLNEREPLFNVMQFPESGFKGTVVDYRNILKVLVDPSTQTASAGVQYDVTASPQVVVTLQGPTRRALAQYVAEHGAKLVQIFEGAERDRSIAFANKFNQAESSKIVREKFGVDMKIPKGYVLAQQSEDFLWFRYEFPSASQGFMLYSYPYEGPQSLSEEALLDARNRFAARIPGPSDGSYMTTSKIFMPQYRMFRLEGRAWVEMRGFWDVEGDFMGGPFVSYTTVDAASNRVFTLDCYVFSPKNPKRNYMREVEHLLHLVKFPAATGPVSMTITFPDRNAAEKSLPELESALRKYGATLSES